MSHDFTARNLAAACLSGPWSEQSVLARARQAHGSLPAWLRRLLRALLRAHPQAPSLESVQQFIQSSWAFCRHGAFAPVRQLFVIPPVMTEPRWPVPVLSTPGALADFLAIPANQLDALADCQFREARRPPGPLANYVYRWLAGRSGKLRLLEMPKRRLKAVQRRVLAGILEAIPAHDAVHSYRRGRSAVTYAAPHAGQAIVLRFDLRNFFPAIGRSRVQALFRTAGYPREVARLLAGLCTNCVPAEVLDREDVDEAARQCYRVPHLPQGAPTSPALANLCAQRLDRRLAGLARRLGATYMCRTKL